MKRNSIIGVFAAGALGLVPLAAHAKDDKGQQSQDRSSEPAKEKKGAGNTSETGPQRPGIESGTAEGMAGGRTDRGPKGEVGIADDHTTTARSNKRANAADQGRKPGKAGQPPQRADTEGGGRGDHGLSYAEPLREEGKRIPSKGEKKRGRAQGKIEQPGGSGPEGISGHDTGGVKGPAPAPEGQSTGAPKK